MWIFAARTRGRGRGGWLLAGLLAWSWLAGGCTTVRVTDPPRTATEQFLLSRAVTEAVEKLATETLRGRRVYVDRQYFKAVEADFVVAEVRAHLLRGGVALMEQRDQAEIVLELRSGGVGIDRYEFLLGLPSIPIGAVAGAAGAPPVQISTPELALLKNTRQLGTAEVAFVAYWADTGELVASSGPFLGRTRRIDWWFFGWGPNSISDIPTTKEVE